MTDFKIGKNLISNNGNVYFIADIGANHDGDIERAYKLIELAKESGAHAAKFQNFQANKIVSKLGFDKMKGKLSHQSNSITFLKPFLINSFLSPSGTRKIVFGDFS